MSVSFYGYVLVERDGQSIWTWPAAMNGRLERTIVPAFNTPEYAEWLRDDSLEVTNPNYDSRIDVNINNRNAQFLLNELGFLPDGDLWDSAPMPIDVFEAGLRATLARNPQPIPGFPGHDTKGQPGPRTIVGGVADGYANVRFAELVLLVEAAREYGATHIAWG